MKSKSTSKQQNRKGYNKKDQKTSGVPPRSQLNHSLDYITAYVSVASLGGVSIFSGKTRLTPKNVTKFYPKPSDLQCVINRLQEQGFRIERTTRFGLKISASSRLFTKHFGIHFEKKPPESVAKEVFTITPYVPTTQTLTNLLDTGVKEIEGLAFPQPISLHASATPPKLNYHHLEVPADIVKLLNAGPVQKKGNKGQNVRAAMIDSGFQWSHPYFVKQKYDVEVALPAGSDIDKNGHGTGESANYLAVAPGSKLFGLSMDDTIEAFQTCRRLGVQVISNSWGSAVDTDGPNMSWDPYWTLVQAEIVECVRQGIIVMFSGGNGGMSFTASMPETISIGGAYIDEKGKLMASDYASSFKSIRYPGSNVPEVCGLVGMQPSAIYIALPIPPKCEIDRQLSGKPFPNKDETKSDDGWGVFSGTSAACPMVAGVVSLILSAYPGSTLSEVRDRLYKATDVKIGSSSMGDAAKVGKDLATGYGLVDAAKACA